MNRMILAGVMGFCLLSPLQTKAQDVLKVTPTGRILMDAALYDSKNASFVNGVAIPDIRIGVKASYGKFKGKVDIGYAYGKVSLKDVFVERQLTSSSLLRVGNFVHQFGLQSSTSSSMKITMEEPTSNEAFFNSRLIGAMYLYDKNEFFAAASV
ncbi:MAG: ATPase, partial [Bacteroides sp.]